MSPFWMAVKYFTLTPEQRATCVFSRKWLPGEYREMRRQIKEYRAYWQKLSRGENL